MEYVHARVPKTVMVDGRVIRNPSKTPRVDRARSEIRAIVHGGSQPQAKGMAGGGGPGSLAETTAVIGALRGDDQALQKSAQDCFKARFGRGLSRVRIRSDARAHTVARNRNARVFYGDEVVFGAGERHPENHEGTRLIAHELTHAAQRSNGDDAVRRQSTVCCAGDEMEPIITNPAQFNINEYIDIPSGPTWPAGEFCTKQRCVRIRVRSKWASRHSETKFRVKLFNYTTSTVTNKDFNVGSDVNSYRVPRCSNFYIRIEVINPATSPNLKGKLWMNYC